MTTASLAMACLVLFALAELTLLSVVIIAVVVIGGVFAATRVLSHHAALLPPGERTSLRAGVLTSLVTFTGVILTLLAHANFNASLARVEPSVVAQSEQVLVIAGVLFSVALGLTTLMFALARRRESTLAAGMSAELERLAMVARCTRNMVLICDANRRIIWVNDAYTRVTGYTLEESLGRNPGEIL
ncbi:MAG: PAS domain-containing protein [Phycisphaerales bacterium]|nr:PAS domain-containing protein [Phycisphaeraceae bacterium]